MDELDRFLDESIGRVRDEIRALEPEAAKSWDEMNRFFLTEIGLQA